MIASVHNKSVLSRVFCLSLMLFLPGCGGSSGDGTEEPKDVSGLQADAGPDLTVTEGEWVDLKAGGSGEINVYSWTQIAGQEVDFFAVDIDAGHVQFEAPDTYPDTALEMQFRLRVIGEDGDSATDQVTVVIEGVNAKPTIESLSRPFGYENEENRLEVSASDQDGRIKSIHWTQIGGPPVDITPSGDFATLSSESVEGATDYEFEVVAIDHEGEEASVRIDYTIYPENMPRISVQFPPEGSQILDPTMTLYGTIENSDVGSIALDTFRVEVGEEEYVATVEESGDRWRIDGVPAGVGEFEAYVYAQTAGVEVAPAVINYERTGAKSIVSSGDLYDVSVSGDNEVAYLLWSRWSAEGTTVVPYDLISMEAKPGITDNSNEDKGPQLNAVASILHDEERGVMYVGKNPSDLNAIVYAIDMETGVRRIVSGGEVGSGPELRSIYDMAFGDDPSEIILVDNQSAALVRLSVETGERELIIDSSATGYPPVSPMRVAYDRESRRLYWSENTSKSGVVRFTDMGWETSAGLPLTGNDGDYAGPELGALNQGIALTEDDSLLFLDSLNDNLVEIDLTSGDKRLVTSSVTGKTAIVTAFPRSLVFSPEWSAALVVGENKLFVIDLESGEKVAL